VAVEWLDIACEFRLVYTRSLFFVQTVDNMCVKVKVREKLQNPRDVTNKVNENHEKKKMKTEAKDIMQFQIIKYSMEKENMDGKF
jgi:UDP-N-acetylenolpyruvoylglucosamine reductase